MMAALQQRVREQLRGPTPSAWFARLGIDARRYWLLLDLFRTLSDRGKMVDQLGRNPVAMTYVAGLYGLFGLGLSLTVLARPSMWVFLLLYLGLTGFLLLSILLSEAANSLMNPTEAMVLAHQPIPGATYVAAKLSHLARIVLMLVGSINLVPSFIGLYARDAGWWYPLLHLFATLVVGLVIGLGSCAFFGWLLRFVPARRLRAASQLAAALPFVMMSVGQRLIPRNLLRVLRDQVSPAMIYSLASVLIVISIAAVIGGLRAFSGDYLARVSTMLHGASSRTTAKLQSIRIGPLRALISRWFGGPEGLAGFAYTARMMRRDFQFRRQAAGLLIYMVIGMGSLLRSLPTDPFVDQPLTAIHAVPHVIGLILRLICSLVPYGGDYEGAWVFQLAPGRAIPRFVRGVHGLILLAFVVAPNLVFFAASVWFWGIEHALLFFLYSLGLDLIYLAFTLRSIEAMPFSLQVDPKRGAEQLPILLLSFIVVGLIVAFQYFVLFRSPLYVGVAAVAFWTAGLWATRRSLQSVASAIAIRLTTGDPYRAVAS